MANNYFRIDDRLIHGQIVTAWCGHLKIGEIVAVDDKLASNKMLQNIMLMGIPAQYKAHVVTTAEAKALFAEGSEQQLRAERLALSYSTETPVTDQAEKLGKEIIEKLRHSVTQIPGKGLYTGKEHAVLVCILNPAQLNELTKLVESFPGSFVTVSQVNTVVGNFKRLDSRNQPEKELLDSGSNA